MLEVRGNPDRRGAFLFYLDGFNRVDTIPVFLSKFLGSPSMNSLNNLLERIAFDDAMMLTSV
jgi:hypothetical protein